MARRIAALRFAIHPPAICGGWNPLAASDMAVSSLARDWCWVCDGLTDCGAAPLSILRFIWRRLESACGFRHGNLMPCAGFVLILRWFDGLRRFASLRYPSSGYLWRLESACGFRHGGLMSGAGLVLGLRWLDGLRRCAAIHPPVLSMTGGGLFVVGLTLTSGLFSQCAVGLEGVERGFDHELVGQPGWHAAARLGVHLIHHLDHA